MQTVLISCCVVEARFFKWSKARYGLKAYLALFLFCVILPKGIVFVRYGAFRRLPVVSAVELKLKRRVLCSTASSFYVGRAPIKPIASDVCAVSRRLGAIVYVVHREKQYLRQCLCCDGSEFRVLHLDA